jgi:redox-sensing transcriptional repressor
MVLHSRQIPKETIDRLFIYFRGLMCLKREGKDATSSSELADVCHVNASAVRKDLSYFGRLGTRGVGYKVDELVTEIRKALRFDDATAVAVVGIGNIGTALLEHSTFELEGFQIVAAFDSDRDKIGRTIGSIVIEDMADVEKRVKEESIELVILAVPEPSAAEVARRLGDAGVKSILSFAPCELTMPDNVNVTCVDLSVAMARLVYHAYFERENGRTKKTGSRREEVDTHKPATS